MEDSIECEMNGNVKDNILDNIDLSYSDPIPSLILPIKKIKKPFSLISHIISISYKNHNIDFSQMQFMINKYITNINLQKHNSTPKQKNIMLMEDLIESKETHFIAVFKDFLISDYQEEFMRRFFKFNEIVEVLPKFYHYYKNYLNFFCKGTFSDFNVNEIMQEYGECQAEFYYNRNYGHKDREKEKELEKKEKMKNNNGMNNNDNWENNNGSNIDVLKLIFTPSIEYSIEKVKNSKYDINNKNEYRQELSNIKPYNDSKDNTIVLPENSTVSSHDAITKENSIRYIINLMNKKRQRITLNKKIKNNKKEILIKNNKCDGNDNKNINNNITNNKNNVNKNEIQKLSKTTSNLNVKNQKNNYNKNNKSRNKSNSLKQNHLTGNNNYKNKNIPSISNYKKYIDILSYKQKNKNNKSNEPKIKFCQEELSFSPNNNKTIKTKKNTSTINANNIFGHFNLFSNNIFNNFGYKNKINSSLFLLNCFDKNYKNINNYNTLFPLSISKNNIGKKKSNNNKFSEKKVKRKSKNKDRHNNTNSANKYLYFNPNIKTYIKTLKNVSSSKNTNNINNNNNNNTSNKSLSYSTVNNCNININNNIILSNNFYHNKHQQQGNSTNKNIQQKKSSINNNSNNNNYFKTFTSRNNQNDINRFKTDVNILNSIINQELNKNKVNINKNSINNQFKIFRKSSNKNNNNNNNCHHHRNLSLKNIPVTARINLYNKCNNSGYKVAKLFDENEFSNTNKTYKNLGIKKSCNTNNHKKKIIFDYKRK